MKLYKVTFNIEEVIIDPFIYIRRLKSKFDMWLLKRKLHINFIRQKWDSKFVRDKTMFSGSLKDAVETLTAELIHEYEGDMFFTHLTIYNKKEIHHFVYQLIMKQFEIGKY